MQNVICGIDEAGRGPLAGDVFAAAVVFPPDFCIPSNMIITDSKKLSSKKREELFDFITTNCVYSIQRASVEEIDSLNILQASLLAMARAVEEIQIKTKFDIIMIDGKQIPSQLKNKNLTCKAIVKGDLLIKEISAASILAKVARDRYMLELDKIYPQYGFCQHMGYPTLKHRNALYMHGVSQVHRKSFSPIKKLIKI
jgi:ribonuclease HII